METLRLRLEEALCKTITNEWGGSVPAEAIREAASVEFTRDSEHGDFTTSLAMKLAGRLKKKPEELAREVLEHLKEIWPEVEDVFARIEIAGGRFLNFALRKGAYLETLREIVARKDEFGKSNIGKGLKVQVEFVSANPTGPLTVAHGRQAAVGEAIANLLTEVDYSVEREFYLNDTGNQIRILGESTYHHYTRLFGKDYPFPEDGYRGDYIADVAFEIAEAEGKRFLDTPPEKAIEAIGELAAGIILEGIKKDLHEFGVTFDVYYSQRELEKSGKVEKVLAFFKEKGLAYEKDGALWLKTSEFGDVEDRVLKKSDGLYTYRTADIAYHKDKFDRGFTRVINLWGPDHHGHVQTMAAAIKALGYPRESVTMMIVQFCTLYEGKEKLKMSTRSGQFITLREVFENVGVDASRYFFLNRKTDSHLDFDLELAKKESPENPVYYIQYAHARTMSVFAKALEKAKEDPEFGLETCDFRDGMYLPREVDLSVLEENDLGLVRFLGRYPRALAKAASDLDPARLTTYLEEVASYFHNYYSYQRIITDEILGTKARLFLLSALRLVLGNALRILGIRAPEKM